MTEYSKKTVAATKSPDVPDAEAKNDYPLDHVPQTAKKSFFSVAAVLLGITFFSPTMTTGAQLGEAFSFGSLIWILIAGNLVLGVYVAVNCAIGAKTGLTSVMLSRYTLGTIGSKWADILLGGTQIGWYAYLAAYMGQMYALAFDADKFFLLFTIGWGILFGVTALWGYRAMEKVAYVAIPALLILVIYIPIAATESAGGWSAIIDNVPTQEMTVPAALTAIVGTFASMGTQACNWSRFSKSAKVGFWSGLIAFLIGNFIMLIAGVVGGIAYQESDFVVVMMSMGTLVMVFAVIILTMNIWTTAHAGAYAWAVAGSEAFNSKKKNLFLVVGLVLALLFACTGIYNQLIGWLVFLGIFIPPLGGAIIGDYFFTYKRRLPKLAYVRFRKFRISPVASYVVGVVVAYVTNQIGFGVPPLFGIVASGLCILLFNAIFKNDMHEIAKDAEYI
ncbi:MAG: cytosine permease [Clostridiales Family XIII bacterium]|jgi:cytosine permease|nr:cytosine permease [Clostridiales Family XIII bacterium]